MLFLNNEHVPLTSWFLKGIVLAGPYFGIFVGSNITMWLSM